MQEKILSVVKGCQYQS